MKNNLFFLMFVIGIVIPAAAQSDDEFEVLQKPDNTITITGYTGGLSSVIIPSNIYGQIVNEVGSNAFSGNKNLKSVVIPNTVAIIGNSAFSSNTNLKNVSLGSGLLSIGDLAFSENGIESIELPAGLRSIGNSAFSGNKLASVVIPNSVLRVGVDAFARNKPLSGVILGSGLENIFFNAFGSGENALSLIVVRKEGLNLNSVGLDQSFVNVYSTGGKGVYRKQGNVWIKDSADPLTFALPAPVSAPLPAVQPSFASPPKPAQAGAAKGASSGIPPSEAAAKASGGQGKSEPSGDFVGKVYTIYFPGNSTSFTGLSASLSESNRNVFEELSAVLKDNPELKVKITGYANPLRPSKKEERSVLYPISLKRAQIVAQMLEFQGVSSGRMTVTGAGGALPLANYSSRENWFKNRRVEITVSR
jgi:outer membrane protein OmpA-like peptidoglycan-associated protein